MSEIRARVMGLNHPMATVIPLDVTTVTITLVFATNTERKSVVRVPALESDQ